MSSLAIFISVLGYFGNRPLVAMKFLKAETTPEIHGGAGGMGGWVDGWVSR